MWSQQDWHGFRETHEARMRGFGFRPPFPPGGPGPHHGRGGRGGRRASIRPAILALLLERPMHGYEMIQELERRTGGIWRPSPGSVYPMLQLLEDGGLIVAEESEGRRRFRLTDAGRAEAEQATHQPPWQEYTDDNVSQAQEFRDAAFGIMNALRQVGFAGTEQQRAQALTVLTETKRKLYAILAESE